MVQGTCRFPAECPSCCFLQFAWATASCLLLHTSQPHLRLPYSEQCLHSDFCRRKKLSNSSWPCRAARHRQSRQTLDEPHSCMAGYLFYFNYWFQGLCKYAYHINFTLHCTMYVPSRHLDSNTIYKSFRITFWLTSVCVTATSLRIESKRIVRCAIGFTQDTSCLMLMPARPWLAIINRACTSLQRCIMLIHSSRRTQSVNWEGVVGAWPAWSIVWGSHQPVGCQMYWCSRFAVTLQTCIAKLHSGSCCECAHCQLVIAK